LRTLVHARRSFLLSSSRRAAQVENYKSIREFGAVASRAAQGSKPCIVFAGDGFETDAVRPHEPSHFAFA
jgi:hypothetical protein